MMEPIPGAGLSLPTNGEPISIRSDAESAAILADEPAALVLTSEPVRILPSEPSDGVVAQSDKHRALAVLTSGGDSQGMNAAIRSIVRMALWHGMRAYAVQEGYQGLVDGAIEELNWQSVSSILERAGTVIGTGRSDAFLTTEGRLKAAENLVKLRIKSLVVIGGNGSLKGAIVFKEEWSGMVEQLLTMERVTEEEAKGCAYLNIVGLVGTVDNDVCGTDMSIGADSALHRIVDAIDCITTTAASHQRNFVLEVMGMDCGYLAQMAAIAGGADWVIIPEKPPKPGWEERMCKKLSHCRKLGRRLSLVVISQYAIDINNQPIKSEYVEQMIKKSKLLGYETRRTVLGHVQRGGSPSAYDRVIATQMGSAAALLLLEAKGEFPPKMVGVQGNSIVTVPLTNCVELMKAIKRAREACNFKRILELKTEGFRHNLALSRRLAACRPMDSQPDCSYPTTTSSSLKRRLAIINVGAPAAGTNSAVRAFTRLMQYQGHTVLGIFSGFDGLLKGSVRELTWEEVSEWGMEGGSRLIANRRTPQEQDLRDMAAMLARHKIHGLLVIGGFEGYLSLKLIENNRELYPEFRIPLLGIAATMSNNVPGSEYSLGTDTALNMIVSHCDILRHSNKRVFVVETFGRYCGYLATVGGLAAGADAAYIFEKTFTDTNMREVAADLVSKSQNEGDEHGLLIRNEKCNDEFTCEYMEDLLKREGEGTFTARTNKLGHLQDGYRPSPYDRIMGVKFASHAVDYFINQMPHRSTGRGGYVRQPEPACMVGIRGNKIQTTPIQALVPKTDELHRISREPQRWLDLHQLLHILARHKDTVKDRGQLN